MYEYSASSVLDLESTLVKDGTRCESAFPILSNTFAYIVYTLILFVKPGPDVLFRSRGCEGA